MTHTFLLHGDNVELLRSFPDASIDAVVTDPPYGLGKQPDARKVIEAWLADEDVEVTGGGFMGKKWDKFVPGPAVWRECLRVLKPGGHLLAFFGTRTVDIGGLSIRLAGFEIRDMVAWLYGSGFPKYLNVSKELDKRDAAAKRRERALRFTEWMRTTGLTSARIDELTNSKMGSHYLTAAKQPAVASEEHLSLLWPHLVVVPGWVVDLVRDRTVESETFRQREVVGQHPKVAPGQVMRENLGGAPAGEGAQPITISKTPEAQQWEGWTTALKPALEPIVLARKPFQRTVAENVLRSSTGAMNTDACRIGERWPANVALDEEAAAQLDEQAPAAGQLGDLRGGEPTAGGMSGPVYGSATAQRQFPRRDAPGGASRFFYCPKTKTSEREAGLDHLPIRSAGELTGGRKAGSAGLDNPRAGAGRKSEDRRNAHPTVKPINLMRWLVRLITPPGGTVLDPFVGSGTPGIASALEGFHFVGLEQSADYVQIAEARIAHWKAEAA